MRYTIPLLTLLALGVVACDHPAPQPAGAPLRLEVAS